MASTAAETALKQAQNRARQFLDTNNSLTSKISDEMFSLLEAGEGSFYLRDQLDNILNDYIRTSWTRTLGYDRTKLRQLMSIKDKIAYVTAIQNTRIITTRWTGVNMIAEDDQIKETLRTVVEELDNRLITNQEFTESWILRHAAINRFSCNLETAERAKLNTFANKVKKLCTDQWFDILAESANFTFESDAQKIIKLNEIISQLSAMGVVIPDDILKEFSGNGEKDKDGKALNWFERHIEKLKTLDKAYKHLTNTLHMVHETAKTTDKSMITPKQKKQLDEVMDKLELKKTIEESIVNFNKDENLDKNTEHWTPMELLKTIRWWSKFNEVVSEMGIENDFDHWFLSWITFELTHWAHSLLTKKKSEAFGGEKKKYEEDCNSRRGMMRNRIFEVYDRNAALRGVASSERDFADDADYDRMNSYFTKFPNLFFNSPDDNYNHVEGENPADRNALHFDKMRSILAAVLRRRVPALRSSDRIRRWSYPKMIVERARHALKGDERGIFNWIDRQIEHADDASIIAMTIMFQNEANNKLFYEEKDPFEVKPKRYSKIFKKVAGAERWRQAVRDKFAPATNFALKATETTVKGVVWATAWTAQKWASIINTPLESINVWLSKQSARNPMRLGMIATKPMQRLLTPLSKGIKTGKDGERKMITEALSNWYKVWTEALPVKEGEEKKTKYLYQWLTRGLESITEFFGKTVANSWQWMEDKYITASKRNVLWALYDAGQKEDRWKDLMASGWLSDVLNLKNIWPKLFDDDGRILPVDKPAEKYPEDQDGIKKLQKDIFGKQYDEVQKQFEIFHEDTRKKRESLDKKLEDISASSPEYDNIKKQLTSVWISLNTRKDEQNIINQILISIQKVGTWTSDLTVLKKEINTSVSSIKDKLDTGNLLIDNDDVAHLWMKQEMTKAKEKIKNNKQKKSEIETQLSLVTKWDPSMDELKRNIVELEDKIRGKNDELRTKNDEIAKHKWSIKKSEGKSRNLEKIIWEFETKKKNYSSLLESIKSRETEKSEAEKNIKDPDLNKDERKNLQKRINSAEANLIKNKSEEDILRDVSSIEDKINTYNEELNNNEKEVTTLEYTISVLNKEADNISDSIRKLSIERDQKYTKVASKSEGDESWATYTKNKNDLEQEIDGLEKDVSKYEKDIEKQEQKNRVYRKIWKRWQAIEEKIDNLLSIDSINTNDKRKLLKKTLENLDLSFEKKAEVATTNQQQVKQTNNALTWALTASTPAPVTA